MKKILQSIGVAGVVLVTMVALLCVSLVYGQSNNGLRGAFNGPISLASTYAFTFGDQVSSDITLQKTAANVLTIGGGIPALTYAGGTVTTNGTAVASGVCQTQPALTVTGATTSSAVLWSVPTALPATWQTGIDILPVVTANTVTLSLCNSTAGSITPAAQAVNVRVIN